MFTFFIFSNLGTFVKGQNFDKARAGSGQLK